MGLGQGTQEQALLVRVHTQAFYLRLMTTAQQSQDNFFSPQRGEGADSEVNGGVVLGGNVQAAILR